MDIKYQCGELYTPQSIGGSPIFTTFGGWQTNDINFFTAYNWLRYFTNIALSQFEWEGLPDGITAYAVESCLLYNGLGGMFRDDSGRLAFAPATPVGRLDAYYEPVIVNFVLPNGAGSFRRSCRPGYVDGPDGAEYFADAQCTTLFDNTERYPMMAYIDLAVRRIAKCDRVCDVNVMAQSTPWIARAGEMARKDIINKVMQITGNESVIVETDMMQDDTSLDVLRTDAPFVADKVLDIQARIINQLFTFMGVDNSFTHKRERAIVDEIAANNEQVMLARKSRLSQRQEFCERCNALFGTSMSVAWSVDHDGDGRVDMASDSHEGRYAE